MLPKPKTRWGRDDLLALDREDPLAPLRAAFSLPEGVLYLDGNSLGPLPHATPARLEQVLRHEWGEGLVRSWQEWIGWPLRLGAKLAPLLGAQADEVAVTDTTSLNLFKLLVAALRLRPERRVIVTEVGNFPSDLYMMQGVIDILGGRHELRRVGADDVEAALDTDTALLCLTHVNYRTSAMHDMQALTRAAHARGALALWDLCHSAGAVPLALDDCGVDLAVGCGYKYLNGGPGSPAFLFVASRLQSQLQQPLRGWLGHASPFDFAPEYQPAPGMARTLCSTPSILAMAALDIGLDTLLAADMQALRRKSMRLGELFLELVAQECGEHGLDLACPAEASRRGSQVGLRHPQGYAIMQALIARNVIGDFRPPDILRFGLAPLYLRYTDMWDAVQVLRDILDRHTWQRPEFQHRAAVT